jgi:hypothetical protein
VPAAIGQFTAAAQAALTAETTSKV